MPPELIPSDEEYASSEDEDFAPDTAPAQEESSESEAEDEDSTAVTNKSKKKTTKRKRGNDEEAEDAGFENSGDEAIIEKGLKKRKKSRKGGREEEDEGGEGGLVKTRSMRAQEKVERKPLADTKAATVDVDALWATMISGNPIPSSTTEPKPSSQTTNPSTSPKTGRKSPDLHRGTRERSNFNDGPDSMVMIKRTYNFAGKVITEQKLVPKDSAEAKLFLASQESAAKEGEAGKETELFVKPKRGLKKARRSIFEPVVENLMPQRTDLYFGQAAVARNLAHSVGATGKEAKKLNTVEKSAMDWAGFVDKEGYKDELDAAGKKKGAYGERQAFLARVEAKKVEDERRARGLPV
ncbi:hypothetical protein BOTCAL_0646g00050 [Botryotinia calthae]|uniref:SWR1-complex protein 5 n=1 Tax=Botryotinia calthae TaxID=38488 RepID=A0A4Y8CI05_9HELO|nr:hypothetical protein BOTCAL_0646g00050 [Botryotinia calthae]